jgi:hypothetical protein
MRLFVICGAVLVLAGCSAYRMVAPGLAGVPDAVKPVWVRSLETRTAEPGLGAACTRALQARLGGDGDQVQGEESQAALLVSGTLVRVEERPLAFSGQGAQREVEAELSLVVEIHAATVDGRPIYESQPTEYLQVYSASGDPGQVDLERRQVLRLLCEEAAAELGLELIESLHQHQVRAVPAEVPTEQGGGVVGGAPVGDDAGSGDPHSGE